MCLDSSAGDISLPPSHITLYAGPSNSSSQTVVLYTEEICKGSQNYRVELRDLFDYTHINAALILLCSRRWAFELFTLRHFRLLCS